MSVDDDAHVTMPAAFIGHGSPMNTLEYNVYTETWADLGEAGEADGQDVRAHGASPSMTRQRRAGVHGAGIGQAGPEGITPPGCCRHPR